MSRVLDKYDFDMSNVRLLESLYGERLPDLLEPLNQLDADLDAIREQADQYSAVANELETLHGELSIARESYSWQGDAAAAANDFWDGVLTVLKWIAAIILYVVAALLALVALLLFAIGKICELIGALLSWVAAAAAVIVVIIAAARAGGRGNSGRAALTWAALKEVFNTTYMAAMGIVGALGQGIGWLFDMAGKGVMWLALYLIEVGGQLTGEPVDKVKEERGKLFR
jgi:hypothetical protein